MNTSRALRIGLSVAFLAGVVLAQRDPAGGFRRGRGREMSPPRGGGMLGKRGEFPELTAGFLEALRRENPEKYERLVKLREEDRQAFFKELREMLQARRGNKGAGRGRKPAPEELRCRELSRQYHAARDPAEKERLKEELETAVEEAFEARLNGSKERLARIEQEMARFRENIQRLEANREKICETRVQELTRPPELKWDSRW